MGIPKAKVYCCDCSYYERAEVLSKLAGSLVEHCHAPGNIGDHYSPGTGFKRSPREKNKYNSCSKFKE